MTKSAGQLSQWRPTLQRPQAVAGFVKVHDSRPNSPHRGVGRRSEWTTRHSAFRLSPHTLAGSRKGYHKQFEETAMRYMMLIYTRETEFATPEEMKTVADGHRAVMDETTRRGILHGADPLEPTSTPPTVRVDHGKARVT